jgi:eukaryotic-like serine/threonine-protein kinase
VRLSRGTKLQRYEIRSLIGQGGMGEVYLAHDSELGRLVAVKVLNQSDDVEKLRRFRQEAKAISALNHPNILTLYEVGQHKEFHYIVSEYIKGKTLREVLGKNNLTIEEILDIAVQIGNALAAAHESGIVHRDIKPENIIVMPDGYVKVLDFGLAKLTNLEKLMQSTPDAPTASVIHTQSGLIMGTVNYMSPEQLRGQAADERTDVWALGACLFEMMNGRQPFTGDSVSDTIAAILSQPLPPAAPGIAPEFEMVVAKALEKRKEDRFQTAKEFVKALKNLKNYFLSQSNFTFDGASSRIIPAQSTKQNKNETIGFKNLSQLIMVKPTRSIFTLLVLAGFIFAGVALTIYIIQLTSHQTTGEKKIRRLSNTGNRTNAAISPDGRFIAYVQSENGKHSLWLSLLFEDPTGQPLIQPSPSSFANIIFSPDGSWIYFTRFDASSSGTLYRTSLLGSAPQEIIRDIDSPISFSPDGKSFAFIRQRPHENIDCIVISSLDGVNQRILIEKKKPELFIKTNQESLSWSPDGQTIACPSGKIDPVEGDLMSLVGIDVKTAQEKPLTAKKWARIGKVLWTNELNTLLITAAEADSDLQQIIKVTRGDGKTKPVTDGTNDYFNISLNKDSTRLVGTIFEKNSSISIASTAQMNQLSPLNGGGYDGIGGVRYTGDGRIVFVSIESGNPDIWITSEDGSNRRRLTTDEAADEFPVVSKDGKFIVFVSSRTGVRHIWRMNFDGGELRQLTEKGGESFPQITPDGNFVIFTASSEGYQALWRVSPDGGEAIQLTKSQTRSPAISPDGQMIACLTRGTNPDDKFELAVVSMENGEILKTFNFSGENSPLSPATLRWLPDGQEIAYIATKAGVSNIFCQPLAGDDPKKLTEFAADRIFSFDFSSDGKSIVFARGVMRSNLVLIENF